jgi:hypothetical protein
MWGAGQMWGGLHSVRVGPHQSMGRKSGNNGKVRSKLAKLSLPNRQLYQCSLLLLAIDESHTRTIEPSNLRQYGLGASFFRRDLIGKYIPFEINLKYYNYILS